MSDPRTDFFSGGAQGAPDDSASPDSRTAFFTDDKPVKESAAGNAKKMAPFVGSDSDAASEGGVGLLEAAAHGASGMVGHLGGGLTYLGTLAATRDPAAAESVRQDTQNALTYEPRTDAGKQFVDAAGKLIAPVGRAVGKGISHISDKAADKYGPLAGALETAALHAPLEVAGAKGAEGILNGAGEVGSGVARGLNKIGLETEPVVASGSPQSLSAAKAAPNISDASAPLQQAVRDATRKGPLNETALQNHLEADKHGVQLMEGQATRDPAQFSNEQNSTHGAIVKRINDQEDQMIDALDNIRQEAGPGTVQNNPVVNGQIVLDRLKNYDKPVVANIDKEYSAARTASASGDLQMDGATFVKNAETELKPQSKFRFLPGSVQSIIDDVKSAGGKLNLDDYQAYSTQLGNEIAKAKRAGDGNAAFAIKNVKDALDNAEPIGEESAEAKALFNKARASAKARFDEMDADPAYEAAVHDDVAAGKPSALADNFLDKYVLQGKRANVERLVDKLDPETAEAVASHTLSGIRKSAVGGTGKISPNAYSNALAKYDSKLDLLVRPETQESLESLGRVIHNAKVAPPGNFVNYSKSGVISNAAHGVAQPLAEAAINAKTFGMGVPVIKGIAESNFAKRSLAPGAGLTKPMPEPAPITRATGGKVDHEALVTRLVGRWKAARKETNKTTESLLKVPDSAIIKALNIAQEHI